MPGTNRQGKNTALPHVLHAKHCLGTDGATQLMLEIARKLQGKVIFDWLLRSVDGNDNAANFEKLGSTIHVLPASSAPFPKRKLIEARSYIAFFKEHDWETVHINTDNAAAADILSYARMAGVPQRIIHSHNSRQEAAVEGTAQRFAPTRKLYEWEIAHSATDWLACSRSAAKWLFPDALQDKVLLVNNGIDTNKFSFNPHSRARIRQELGISENDFLIGHVGRFSKQKNHDFLLDVFSSLTEKVGNARLLLIGTGPLEESMKSKAELLGISEQVIFLGTTSKVDEYLSAMDCMAMPSLFEGFSIAAIEAQCSGLPCLFSDTISRETKLLESARFLPIDSGAACWVGCLADLAKHPEGNRKAAAQVIASKGFSLDDAAAALYKLYSKNYSYQ